MGDLAKLFILASLAARRPSEFCDRVRAFADVRLDRILSKRPLYSEARAEALPTIYERLFGASGAEMFSEAADPGRIEAHVKRRLLDLSASAPFPLAHNADLTLGRFCYIACRCLRPQVVVETGVAYGLSPAFILAALEANGGGKLASIDLPPLGRDADQFVGFLIPQPPRHHWQLYRGTSSRILPKLLLQVGSVDFFLHDSLHTYHNMKSELSSVAPFLARPSLVVADDIQGNGAFLHWAKEARPDYWAAIREESKEAMFGIAVFR